MCIPTCLQKVCHKAIIYWEIIKYWVNFIIFLNTGIWTHGLELAKQLL
jgi:hypothetical protein